MACQQCHCRGAKGTTCGQQLDEQGYHAVTEQLGGGTLQLHTRLAKAVGSLVQLWCLVQPLYEQRVLAWDRPSTRRGEEHTVERAILDLEYVGPEGRRWIDVTVRHPAAGDESAVRAAARKDGSASRRAERQKHQRYPGANLIPFAVETPGRLGAEARAWLLGQVCNLPVEDQTRELMRAYRVISCAVHGNMAQQLRRAAGLR